MEVWTHVQVLGDDLEALIDLLETEAEQGIAPLPPRLETLLKRFRRVHADLLRVEFELELAQLSAEHSPQCSASSRREPSSG